MKQNPQRLSMKFKYKVLPHLIKTRFLLLMLRTKASSLLTRTKSHPSKFSTRLKSALSFLKQSNMRKHTMAKRSRYRTILKVWRRILKLKEKLLSHRSTKKGRPLKAALNRRGLISKPRATNSRMRSIDFNRSKPVSLTNWPRQKLIILASSLNSAPLSS